MNNEEKNLNVIFAIISFVFPIIGAILYYYYKKTNLERAKICNKFAWISFGIYFVLYLLTK